MPGLVHPWLLQAHAGQEGPTIASGFCSCELVVKHMGRWLVKDVTRVHVTRLPILLHSLRVQMIAASYHCLGHCEVIAADLEAFDPEYFSNLKWMLEHAAAQVFQSLTGNAGPR